MAHDEFPPLQRAGINILQSANLANYSDSAGGVRPFAAAVIREAVKQAAPFPFQLGSCLVVAVADLSRIADNLHAPPPPPPTREQMEEALQHLIDMYGARVAGESTDEHLQTLQSGIAHYCEVQP
jgi:hypothetical protein